MSFPIISWLADGSTNILYFTANFHLSALWTPCLFCPPLPEVTCPCLFPYTVSQAAPTTGPAPETSNTVLLPSVSQKQYLHLTSVTDSMQQAKWTQLCPLLEEKISSTQMETLTETKEDIHPQSAR